MEPDTNLGGEISTRRGVQWQDLNPDISLWAGSQLMMSALHHIRGINAFIKGIFCVVEFWDKVAQPTQNGA